MLLVIDNYDSFTYNLVQYFQQLGQEVVVYRNDEISLTDIQVLDPQYICISPGPGTPDQAGICLDLIKQFSGMLPILGVCLGHQAIARAFGAEIVVNWRQMHGKTSLVNHNYEGVFRSLPNPLSVVRYHSLVVNEDSLPTSLIVTARTEEGEIMGISHRQYPLHGVQFHPESILSEAGYQLLENFLSLHEFYKKR